MSDAEKQALCRVLFTHTRRYPVFTPQDAVKLLYQSEFGSGHMITDEAAVYSYLLQELAATPDGDAPLRAEPIGGGLCRLHLAGTVCNGLSPRTIFQLFLRASAPRGSRTDFLEKIAVLRELCAGRTLPFSLPELDGYLQTYQAAGYPAVHHSEAYRAAYAPAYRLIRAEDARFLPLFADIDTLLTQKERICIAVEGCSGAGKSTLAQALSTLYDCTVLHMDDFFLPIARKTPERLAEPGGNVDYERFAAEVVPALKAGTAIPYRVFDCGTQTLQPPEDRMPGQVVLVEGVYSMHPRWTELYDLRVFLTLSPENQRARIRARNGEKMLERFVKEWIPLENRYFEAEQIQNKCDLIIETDTEA